MPAAVCAPAPPNLWFIVVPSQTTVEPGTPPAGGPSRCKLVRRMHEPCVLYFPHVRDKQHTVVEISMQE